MMDSLAKLWSKLEIRVLVVCSLGLQILLLSLAGYRKHVVSFRWSKEATRTWKGPLAFMFHLLLWLAYLLADYVATVALAYLPNSADDLTASEKKTHQLLMFWSPFFLLHLGGQDTITALSIEDNELWSRHLLTLLSQAALAMYNYFISNVHIGSLWPPAALMFIVGCFKYGERIWALQRASMSALRSSMITKPDPGPNYAKFMQEYTSSNAAGLVAEIIVEVERHKSDDPGSKSVAESKPPNEAANKPDDTQQSTKVGESKPPDNTNKSDKSQEAAKIKLYADLVSKAYKFFPTFKRLFVDLIMSYKDREESKKYFDTLTYKDAYKVIEIELSWMYEILHSKAAVIYSIKHYGWASRILTVVFTSASLILFATMDHNGYGRSEVALTYVLIGGALGLEVVAIVSMLLSLWTYAVMKDFGGCCGLADVLFRLQEKLRSRKKSRWSNKMAQFSLIDYSRQDKPHWWKPTTWDHYRYTTYQPVSKKLKELLFEELRKKTKSIDNAVSYRRFTEHRGQWALQRKGYYQEFGWSVEAEFDESLLLWHIATDLLFEELGNKIGEDNPNEEKEIRLISQHISNYMLFLQVVRPFMMPAGIGQIRFGDTCAEARNFLQQEEGIKKGSAVKMILGVNTDYDPGLVKGDRSKSVLFDGCKLAHELQKAFENDYDRMWRMICMVWIEMLCFAASKCSGQFHAKQLSKGGELLTVVWFLMAHFGMGEQYRIEEGHARAKLIISK